MVLVGIRAGISSIRVVLVGISAGISTVLIPTNTH